MIAARDATARTMRDALATSISALDAASELDVDRTNEDRAFFAAEKSILMSHYDAVSARALALEQHVLLSTRRLQRRVEIGDAVLDRGVRAGKQRMKLDVGPGGREAVDHVFPSDISDIVDADRHVEPTLVLKLVARFAQVADYSGKDALRSDLEQRATRQAQCFKERAEGKLVEADLDGAEDRAVALGSDALYRLEKRLLERFPRERVYVRAFFLDVSPPRKRAKAAPAVEPEAQ